jgi:hypothetical protein
MRWPVLVRQQVVVRTDMDVFTNNKRMVLLINSPVFGYGFLRSALYPTHCSPSDALLLLKPGGVRHCGCN